MVAKLKHNFFYTFNIGYAQIMNNRWYRHFHKIAAIFIFIGGVGLSASHTMPVEFYIVSLAVGVAFFAIFMFKKLHEHPEDDSNTEDDSN